VRAAEELLLVPTRLRFIAPGSRGMRDGSAITVRRMFATPFRQARSRIASG